MMSDNGELATGFQRVSRSDWHSLVERSLRDNSFDSLRSVTDDEIAIAQIGEAAAAPAALSANAIATPWFAVQRIDSPDSDRARQIVLADLAGGVGGIELVMAGSASAMRGGFGLPAIDDDLIGCVAEVPEARLRLDAGANSYALAAALRARAGPGMTLAYDPLAEAAAAGGFARPIGAIESDILAAVDGAMRGDRAGQIAMADGRVWAAGGASEAQELAGILGSLVHLVKHLIATGMAPGDAFALVGICVDAGANQLVTVAKLRALRLLHARIVEAFGAPPARAAIHAETSWRMMTRHDVHTNILRTTSAAFAAGMGGADSITILPFTIAAGLPDAFARRIARNIRSILIDEAGIARILDPAAGAGAIEHLTTDIARAAWEKFRVIEAGGGLLAAIRSGSFQKEIAAMRRRRGEKIARREIAITGVSEFPLLDEADVPVLDQRRPDTPNTVTHVEGISPLVTARLAEPFEALRDRAAALAKAGAPPSVALAGLGVPTDIAGIAQAARNFFAAGGIGSVAIDGRGTAREVTEAFARSGASSACLVGTPEVLAAAAGPVAAALKAAGAARIFVMGGAMIHPAIDAAIDDGVDMVTFLGDVLDRSPTG